MRRVIGGEIAGHLLALSAGFGIWWISNSPAATFCITWVVAYGADILGGYQAGQRFDRRLPTMDEVIATSQED